MNRILLYFAGIYSWVKIIVNNSIIKANFKFIILESELLLAIVSLNNVNLLNTMKLTADKNKFYSLTEIVHINLIY